MIRKLLKQDIITSHKYKILYFDFLFTILLGLTLLIFSRGDSFAGASMLSYFLPLTVFGLSAVFMTAKIYTEKRSGVFRTLNVTSMTKIDYFVSKILYSYITITINLIILLSMAVIANAIQISLANIAIIFLFIIVCAPAAIGFALFAITIAREFNNVIGMASIPVFITYLSTILTTLNPDMDPSAKKFIPFATLSNWIRLSFGFNTHLGDSITTDLFIDLGLITLMAIAIVGYGLKNFERFSEKEI